MPAEIHLDSGGKAAKLGLQYLRDERAPARVVEKTEAGEISTTRVVKGIQPLDNPAGLDPEEFIKNDPELDLEAAGEILDPDELSTAYYAEEPKSENVISDFERLEIIYTPEGKEKERRPQVRRKPNINEIHPVKAGKRLPRDKTLIEFAFRQCLQIVHSDGLGYEFLHGIAKDLHERKEMALLGSGPKGNQPLVLREGGSPYRAFLYGEVGEGEDADKYRLLLLLSNMELKQPAAAEAGDGKEKEDKK